MFSPKEANEVVPSSSSRERQIACELSPNQSGGTMPREERSAIAELSGSESSCWAFGIGFSNTEITQSWQAISRIVQVSQFMII